MNQKTALVTGANVGMGRATALALAKKGIFVVMLCRNRQRGEKALAEIKKESGSNDVALLLCDLADMQSIREACQGFWQRYPQLDILINNAGVLCFKRQETKDGLELHFGVGHIGHFLLTLSLLECMHPGSRIVMVSSVAHKAGRIDFDDIGMRRGYSVFRAYSRAKLCNMLFTKELARRLNGTGITINAVHPGAVITNIGASRTADKEEISKIRLFFGKLLRWFVKTPEKGAATAIYVATSPACEGISGAYFANCKVAKASKKSEDKKLAGKLWALSEEITGISGPVFAGFF